MLRATLAVVSVLACVDVRASHVSAPAADQRCSLDLLRQISHINETMRSAPADQWCCDFTLYTPDVHGDKLLCSSVTLRCFADELTVLQEELDINMSQANPSSGLKRLSKRLNQSDSACRQCELQQEQDAAAFLSALLSILKEINAQYC